MSSNAAHPRYLAIVPARGGSKRLPGKNLLPVGGKPLLGYTLEAARATRRLDAVVVSTDSEQIAAYALSHGVDPQGTDQFGWTARDYADWEGHDAVARLLPPSKQPRGRKPAGQ